MADADRQFRLLQKCGLHLGGGGPRACWKWSASLDNSPARAWKICPANQYPLIKTMAWGQRQARQAGGSSISLYVCHCEGACVGLSAYVCLYLSKWKWGWLQFSICAGWDLFDKLTPRCKWVSVLHFCVTSHPSLLFWPSHTSVPFFFFSTRGHRGLISLNKQFLVTCYLDP